MIRRPSTLLVALLLAACGGDAPALAARQDTAALRCETILTPADEGGDGIGAVAPGPKGWLAWTPDRGSQRVLLRAPDGRITAVGRDGEGPGEFRHIYAAGWLGDSVWAGDYGSPRLQLFDTAGKLTRAVLFARPEGWIPTGGGRFAVIPGKPLADSVWWVLGTTEGSDRVDTVARFTATPPERVTIPMGGGASILSTQPLAPDARLAWSPDGARWCGTEPGSGGDVVRLRCVGPDGTVLHDTALTLAGRPVTDTIYEHEIAGYLRPSTRREDITAAIKRPALLPRVLGLLVDRSGAVWLRRSHAAEAEVRWLRFAADGAVRDTLVLPGDWRVRAVAHDTAWVVREDAEGGQTLQRCAPRSR